MAVFSLCLCAFMGDPGHVEFSVCSNLTLLIIATVGFLFPKNLILQDSSSHESGEEAVSTLACIKSEKKKMDKEPSDSIIVQI